MMLKMKLMGKMSTKISPLLSVPPFVLYSHQVILFGTCLIDLSRNRNSNDEGDDDGRHVSYGVHGDADAEMDEGRRRRRRPRWWWR